MDDRPEGNPQPVKRVAGKRRTTQKVGQERGQKQLTMHTPKYDVVGQLSNAPSGLTFGQLLRGDADEAERNLTKLFSAWRKQKNRVVETTQQTLKDDEARANSKRSRRSLKVAQLKLYGAEVHALLDIMSKDLMQRLNLSPTETNCSISVANGNRSRVVGIVTSVPTSFSDLVVSLEYLVVEQPPFDAIIGDPDLSELGGILDLGRRTATVSKKKEELLLSP